MAKILTGSTLSYGPTLPASAKTADGSMFFLTAPYTDAASSPTNPGAAVLRQPGLYVFSFAQDNSDATGDQVGQGWKQLSSIDQQFVDKIGDTVTGDLILKPALVGDAQPKLRFTNFAGNSGGAISTNGTGANQGIAISSEAGRLDFVTNGVVRASISPSGVFTISEPGLPANAKVWTQENDGAGSELDADKLDGQQGSYYLDPANMNTNPVAGQLGVAKGGTGNSSTVQGGILFGNSTTQIATSAAGTTGQLLQSGGSLAPSWINASALVVGSALTLKSGGFPNATAMTFNQTAVAGNPGALFGTNDGVTYYHYNPGNFTVAQASNANTLANYPLQEAPNGTTVVARNAQGHIFSVYFNSSAPNSEGVIPSNGQVMTTNGSDGYLRKTSLSQLSAAMNLGGSFVYKTGDNMSGDLNVNGIKLEHGTSVVRAAQFTTQVDNAAGGVVIQRGPFARTGYLEFTGSNGVRAGYIGDASAVGGTDQGTITFGMAVANFAGDVVAYASDARLKKNIQVIPNAMEKIATLGGYSYDWDMEKTRRLGFTPRGEHEHGLIAQEVQKVLPDAVVPAPFNEEYLTVKYERLVALLVAGMNEQQQLINTLITEVEELKGR